MNPQVNNYKDALAEYKIIVKDELEGAFTRNKFIKLYGFVLLHSELLQNLACYLRGQKVIDIGSGSGYLSYKLQREGINMTAADDTSWNKCFDKIWKHDTTSIDINNFDTIILSWPPMNNDLALQIAKQIKPNQTLIYQGELSGGCTANDEFFEYIESNFNINPIFTNLHVTFPGKHDGWYELTKM
jgi:hypothetical protein